MEDEKLICPYCRKPQLTHEPDQISAGCCYTQCEHCGRYFWYTVRVIHQYTSYEDDEETEGGSG